MLPPQAIFTASEYVHDLVPKAAERNPDVTVLQESAYELTHPDESFDVVFLLEVLEHLNHWSKHTLRMYMEGHFGPVRQTRSPLPWTIVLTQKQ